MGNLDVDKAMQTLVEHGFIDKDGHPKQIASKLEDAELARDSEETCNNKQVASKLDASKDTISRQAVDTLVDELARAISDERCCISRGRSTATIMQDILDLPPVNQQPRTGHWIFVDKAHEHAHCSECDYGNVDLLDGRPHNYCPNCGCHMV